MKPDADGLVSVIIPFLNPRPAFLREAIESVRNQSYPSWELLLVDDGSRGASVALARAYAEQSDGRIRYLDHDGHRNLGLSATRNRGIAQARGAYLALLDADDVWLPSKLDEQIAILRRHPDVGMIYGCTQYWFSWTGRREDQSRDFAPPLGVPANTVLPPPRPLARMLRGDASVPCPCSVLVRRAVVNQVGGFNEAFTGLYEDQVFYAKLGLHTSVYAAGECWDRYRQHPESLCTGASGEEARAARRRFLRWVEAYVRDAGTADDGTVQRAVARELWALDHPGRARILRSGRRLRRLLQRLGNRVP